MYHWIKNINAIKTKHVKNRAVCLICFTWFSHFKYLKRHLLQCNSVTQEVFPKPNSFISFSNFESAKLSSVVDIFGFCDFECKLMRVNNESENDISAVDKNRSYTLKTEEHEIISFSVIFIDSYGNLLYEKVYCGDHPSKTFLDVLDSIEENLLKKT